MYSETAWLNNILISFTWTSFININDSRLGEPSQNMWGQRKSQQRQEAIQPQGRTKEAAGLQGSQPWGLTDKLSGGRENIPRSHTESHHRLTMMRKATAAAAGTRGRGRRGAQPAAAPQPTQERNHPIQEKSSLWWSPCSRPKLFLR